MSNIRPLAYAALVCSTVMMGCTTPMRQMPVDVSVRYATILDVGRTIVPAAPQPGTILGGFHGLAVADAQEPDGAELARLARAAAGGDRAHLYRLRYQDGTEGDYVTEKGYFRKGDCVAVERAGSANLRRVSRSVCAAFDDWQPTWPIHRRQAEDCARAKRSLLLAETPDEVTRTTTHVEVACHF